MPPRAPLFVSDAADGRRAPPRRSAAAPLVVDDFVSEVLTGRRAPPFRGLEAADRRAKEGMKQEEGPAPAGPAADVKRPRSASDETPPPPPKLPAPEAQAVPPPKLPEAPPEAQAVPPPPLELLEPFVPPAAAQHGYDNLWAYHPQQQDPYAYRQQQLYRAGVPSFGSDATGMGFQQAAYGGGAHAAPAAGAAAADGRWVWRADAYGGGAWAWAAPPPPPPYFGGPLQAGLHPYGQLVPPQHGSMAALQQQYQQYQYLQYQQLQAQQHQAHFGGAPRLSAAPPAQHQAAPPREQRGWANPPPPRDAAAQAAVALNKRIVSSQRAQDILDIVASSSGEFDAVCIATCFHRLATLRGAPGLHEAITRSPEFYKLLGLAETRRAELGARNLANVLWSLARMACLPGDKFMAGLCEEVRKKCRDGNAQNVCNTIWAVASLGFRPGDEVLDALADAVKLRARECTSQNLSNVLLSFAKLEMVPDPELLDALAEEAVRQIKSFTPQALSNSLWGLSKLGLQNAELFMRIGAEARASLHEFNAQNLANSVWAYANLGIDPGGGLLDDFAREIVAKMGGFDFTAQNCSNTVWAYAKLGHPAPELFAAAQAHAMRTLHTWTHSPQSLANFAWAYATARCPLSPALLRGIAGAAAESLPEFSTQHLSNLALASARLARAAGGAAAEAAVEEPLQARLAATEVHRSLLALLSGEASRRLAHREQAAAFSTQHLSSLLSAAAIAPDANPGRLALSRLCGALRERAAECPPLELASVVSSCARLHHYDGQLLEALAAQAAAKIVGSEECSPQSLSSLCQGFAKLAFFHQPLLDAAAAAAAARAGELSLRQLALLLYAFARFKYGPPEAVAPLLGEARRRLAEDAAAGAAAGGAEDDDDDARPAQHVALVLWSAAVLEALDRELWELGEARARALGAGALPEAALNQLFQAYELAAASAPPRPGWPWRFDAGLHAAARATWLRAAQLVSVSGFHAEVSRALGALGEAHTLEQLTDDGLFSVDVAFAAERLALEVDGPRHFTANTLRPLGDMHARTRLLEARGWRVASVPFYAWAGAEEADRLRLLRRTLDAARGAGGGAAHPVARARADQAAAERAAGEAAGAGGQQAAAAAAEAEPRPSE